MPGTVVGNWSEVLIIRVLSCFLWRLYRGTNIHITSFYRIQSRTCKRDAHSTVSTASVVVCFSHSVAGMCVFGWNFLENFHRSFTRILTNICITAHKQILNSTFKRYTHFVVSAASSSCVGRFLFLRLLPLCMSPVENFVTRIVRMFCTSGCWKGKLCCSFAWRTTIKESMLETKQLTDSENELCPASVIISVRVTLKLIISLVVQHVRSP